LLPLIAICREYGTAIRIGVNHGSLSERILNWYGNTPEGMVASAIEFLEIFRAEHFDPVVLSLKASSVRLMIQANRLMVKRMHEYGMSYPLHLGVTEAGDEEEGRIKSAAGIGSLLADGIGDTLRVSLTEDPEEEIPVAKAIAQIAGKISLRTGDILNENNFFNPFSYNRRKTKAVKAVGGSFHPVVINSIKGEITTGQFGEEYGYSLSEDRNPVAGPLASDFIYTNRISSSLSFLKSVPRIIQGTDWSKSSAEAKTAVFPYFIEEDPPVPEQHPELNFIRLSPDEVSHENLSRWNDPRIVMVLEAGEHFISGARNFFRAMNELNLQNPVILHKKYHSKNKEELMIRAATETGSLLLDGFGDGLWLEEENPSISAGELREISFDILQACAARISKTEYIACPSCGRTLFNIQSALKKVKEATAGLRGIKIAVMGCIVNGPGEMADADYGYVGAGPGKITLYKGREAVMKNIPEENALHELLKLIGKDHPLNMNQDK
ncbi:MAG: (E)-4-hydroxy-3-methylbut-2-enyl-diphosphate synthase, partial [Bacteroidales bacterium]|nr:(E)-4-hydroxy-3-methylbut-2-enyl-diphosphate synthase [Bacteroidales bacterium]